MSDLTTIDPIQELHRRLDALLARVERLALLAQRVDGASVAATEADPWFDRLAGALAGVEQTTTAWLLTDTLDLRPAEQTPGHAQRLAAILARLGWWRVQRRVDGRMRWVYLAPSVAEPPPIEPASTVGA